MEYDRMENHYWELMAFAFMLLVIFKPEVFVVPILMVGMSF